MKSLSRIVVPLVWLCLVPSLASAQDKEVAKDRTILTACLAAAKTGKRGPETCIGVVQGPCLKAPGGETTFGMKECGGREIAV